MSLALALGRTLEELSETMSAQEFGLWLAYYKRNPWGEERADLRAAITTAAIANYAGKSLKDGTSVSPAEFMPFLEKEDEPTDSPDPFAHFRTLH